MRRLIYGAVLCLMVFAGSAVAQEPEQQVSEVAGPGGFEPRFAFAIGAGIPFGGLGGSVEAILHRNFSASLGMGVLGGELGWAGGLRVYPIGREQTVSPRLSAYYGTVAILDWGTHTELDTGAAFGVGVSWRNQPRTTLDFDLLYTAYEPPAGFVKKDGGDISLMIGYGWNY